MILRPNLEDLKIIGYYLGKIIIGLGIAMLLPALVGWRFSEAGPMWDFIVCSGYSIALGLVFVITCFTHRDAHWMHGMIVVSLSWLVAMFLGALPLFLSGHYGSYLDACFESMSGFATTGLTLVQDLDHMSFTHNFWRHLIMFIGGQGIVIVILSFFVKGSSGAFKIYVGEAREEQLFPNVVHTSRFIWLVSIVYLILGTAVLGFTGIYDGMKPANAFFHGACIFMAAFDTGGFTPQSQNMLYYHSFGFEFLTMIIMLLGAINFKLHYHIWTGNRKELWKNIETTVLFFSIMVIFLLVAFGLVQGGVYRIGASLFRRGFYQLLSAHTGTGYSNLYSSQFIKEWSNFALVGLVCAMALGGSSCSTTGGIKMLRLGIIFKALVQDIKRIMLPERAVVVQSFHHVNKVFLEDKQVRSAFLITVLYFLLYGIGAIIGMYFGHPFLYSLFESTSAAANVGLSCGITSYDMPVVLKITYMLQMWAGRLEFISVFTLFGFFVAAIKGK